MFLSGGVTTVGFIEKNLGKVLVCMYMDMTEVFFSNTNI